MPFPSQAIRDFCQSVDALIAAPREGRTGHRDGFCQCEVYRAIQYAPPEQQAQLASGIFWAVWIDQVLYYVAVEGGIPEFLADPAVYDQFCMIYPFPKLYSHIGGGHASPYWFLADNRPYPIPTLELLIEDKHGFWGEVGNYLESEGLSQMRVAAVKAFREDLQLRFPQEYGFLFQDE